MNSLINISNLSKSFDGQKKIKVLKKVSFSFDKGKTITIPFTAGTEKIEVFGSYVVPEFGHVVMIILILGIIGMIVFSKKTNSITNLFYTKL